jgi:CheY-like chemotaxis protein
MDANHTVSALLVDNDPGSQQATLRRLEDEGYSVVLVRDQNDGLARAKQMAPNVIFLHLVNGESGSIPFIQALRADDSCRHIRVVVVREPARVQPRIDLTKKQLRTVPRDGW